MKNHEADAQLTQERLELASIEQMVAHAIKTKVSFRPETTLALRSTQLASMCLGKAKGALGAKNPYPASYDKASKVIEPRADFIAATIELPDDEISTIKFLRNLLKQVEQSIKNDRSIMLNHAEYQLWVSNAYTNCCYATMWLGMVLNAIKNEEDAPVKSQKVVTEKPKAPATRAKKKAEAADAKKVAEGTKPEAADKPMVKTDSKPVNESK